MLIQYFVDHGAGSRQHFCSDATKASTGSIADLSDFATVAAAWSVAAGVGGTGAGVTSLALHATGEVFHQGASVASVVPSAPRELPGLFAEVEKALAFSAGGGPICAP